MWFKKIIEEHTGSHEKIYHLVVNGVIWCSIIAGVLVQSYQKIQRPRLTTDFISWALSSMSREFGMGYAYGDYWGINPPGVLSMTWWWGTFIGHSIQSYHILYCLCLGFIAIIVWKIFLHLFSHTESMVLFGAFWILFFSNYLQSQFFASEINGLVFSVGGLYLLLCRPHSLLMTMWASMFFVLAGQMKEVFGLGGLALLPLLFVHLYEGLRSLLRFLASVIAGVSLAAMLLLGYLMINHAVSDYMEITQYKSEQFSIMDIELLSGKLYGAIQLPKETLIAFDYSFPLLLIVAAVALVSSITIDSRLVQKKAHARLELPLSANLLKYLIVMCFWAGSVIGYAMQGRYGHKYDLQPLVGMLLILGIVSRLLSGLLLRRIHTPALTISVCVLLLLVLVAPAAGLRSDTVAVVRTYNVQGHWRAFRIAEAAEFTEVENRIAYVTKPDECILAVYGWGIGSVYYYSRRPACSKYFLVNMLPRDRAEEYRQEVIANPPSAIVYITEQTDMNIPVFEAEVFNFSAVLERCYERDAEFDTVYWPQTTADSLRECIRLAASGSSTK